MVDVKVDGHFRGDVLHVSFRKDTPPSRFVDPHLSSSRDLRCWTSPPQEVTLGNESINVRQLSFQKWNTPANPLFFLAIPRRMAYSQLLDDHSGVIYIHCIHQCFCLNASSLRWVQCHTSNSNCWAVIKQMCRPPKPKQLNPLTTKLPTTIVTSSSQSSPIPVYYIYLSWCGIEGIRATQVINAQPSGSSL